MHSRPRKITSTKHAYSFEKGLIFCDSTNNIREHFRTETYQRRRMCFGNRIMNILYNIHVTLRERICIYSNLLQRTYKVIVEWSLYTCLSVFLSVYYCFRIVHIWFWIYYLGYFNLLSNPYYFHENSNKLEIRESPAKYMYDYFYYLSLKPPKHTHRIPLIHTNHSMRN